jgi:hypothetical protein
MALKDSSLSTSSAILFLVTILATSTFDLSSTLLWYFLFLFLGEAVYALLYLRRL